jgi:hypothetical protein
VSDQPEGLLSEKQMEKVAKGNFQNIVKAIRELASNASDVDAELATVTFDWGDEEKCEYVPFLKVGVRRRVDGQ